MATFNEYYNRYIRIPPQLGNVKNQTTFILDEVRRGAVLGSPDFVGRRLDALDDIIDRNTDALNALSEEIASSDLTQSQQDSLQRAIKQTGEGLQDAQQRIVTVRRQALDNEREKKLRQEQQQKNSAGDIVNEENNASVEGARTQNPPAKKVEFNSQGRVTAVPENTTKNSGTNAEPPNIRDDIASNEDEEDVIDFPSQQATGVVGGADTTITQDQSQRSPNGQSGGYSNTDDAYFNQQEVPVGTARQKPNRPEVPEEFLKQIISKENPLSAASTVTYGLSLYLLSPNEYGEFVASEQKVLPGKQLLMQSAGAPVGARNRHFDVDFYIEDFRLESVIGTQGTGSPHNAVTLEFKVMEPNGISFLNRLNRAVREHIRINQDDVNAFAQTYLMVIRFYGYDVNGDPLSHSDFELPETTDKNAFVEKFIPFVITNFAYKINTKMTEYEIKGACHGTNLSFGTQRGVIPFNASLAASTVDQLFNGNKQLDETRQQQIQELEDAGETNIARTLEAQNTTQTVVRGLAQALNDYQQILVKNKQISIADEYEILFQSNDLKNSQIIKPGNKNKARASNQTAQQSARKYLEKRINYDNKSDTYSIHAGTQIVQLLDLVLRSSSYVTSQQDIYIDEKTGLPVANSKDGVRNSVEAVQWYRIKTQVTPKGYDRLRKTIAYKISYIISPYQINDPRVAYFPTSEYRGVHKLYNYWFTGQNTEVLDFEIDVNANYWTVLGNDGYSDQRVDGKFAVPRGPSPAPGQSLQAGVRGSTVPASALADRLYSMADVATAKIDIVGDPDWIQQSEIVYNKTVGLNTYLPDGGINFDSREALFQIRFNPADQYNLETGLMDIYTNNVSTQGDPNLSQEQLTWCATTVTSFFADGKFTQTIHGVYKDFATARNVPNNPQATATTAENSDWFGKYFDDAIIGWGNDEDNQPVGTGTVLLPGGPVGSGVLKPSIGVETKEDDESPGIVVEIIPNDQFPDDDAGSTRIDSNGNRVNYNLR